MPKKSASAHHGAQRNRPKVQKNFELVRPERVETAEEESSTTSAKVADERGQALPQREESKASGKGSTAVRTKEAPKTSGRASIAVGAKEEPEAKTQEPQNTPAPGSASARLAARRQAAQKLQQRSATTLITSEHFAYVRKDLIKIAVFAVLMFTAIVVLYLTLGRA